MERIDHKVHLSYNDVLLLPYDDAPCDIESRSDPDIKTSIANGRWLRHPLISAPMDTITGIDMAIAMANCGGMGVYTRHINKPDELRQQCRAIEKIKETVMMGAPIACAMGVKGTDKEIYDKARSLHECGADILVLDIANGNHVFMINAIKTLAEFKGKYPNARIVAGNVATPKSAIRLAEAGADAVKVGIGPGGACTTRRVTGFGVPQLTAIMECAPVLRERGVRVIADGGIRYPGDAVKALWAGADIVMMGYVLAGHNECPLVSDVGRVNGVECDAPRRMYRGMASRTVSGKENVAAEGVVMEVEPKGPVQKTINEYAAAIKSACAYGNARNLQELRRNVRAIRVSTMSQGESDPMGGWLGRQSYSGRTEKVQNP